MQDSQCVHFLQWALPQLRMRWPGFRKVRRQVCKRIDRRLRQLDLEDVGAYRGYLQTHPQEWSVLDSFCRISISRFYRDRGVFDYLRQEILPDLADQARRRGDDRLRCWCAGCASGEEVYTLKIIWNLELLPRYPELPLCVVATDADEHMLERARCGCFPASSLKDLPRPWWESAFTRSRQEYCVKQQFRDHLEFQLQDIRRQVPADRFALILCRHLAFTYFDEDLQKEILQRMMAQLSAGGIFVAGKQEPLPAGPHGITPCLPRMGVYRRLGQPEAGQ